MGVPSAPLVLLLEDQVMIAVALEGTLEDAGVQDVVTRRSREGALSWLEDHTPNIVIVDPYLSDGICTDVIQSLTERNIPFIVHSGQRPEEADAELGFQRGQWICKPSDPAAVVAAVKAGIAIQWASRCPRGTMCLHESFDDLTPAKWREEISMQYSNNEQLRRHAYAIWERQGCPYGKDEEIWDLAVKEMNGQAAPPIDQGEWPKAQEEKPPIVKG
jgi:DNA-binding response OmpR family regulator